MSTPPPQHLLIVGAGPAGCAAALAAAARGLSAALVEQTPQPMPTPCGGWVGPLALQWLTSQGIETHPLGSPFAGLRLMSWDFSDKVHIDDAELRGLALTPAALAGALQTTVTAKGIQIHRPRQVTSLAASEQAVTITLDNGDTLAGAVAIVADGTHSQTAGLAQFTPVHGSTTQVCAAAILDDDTNPGLDVLLGTAGGLQLATIARDGKHARVLVRGPHSAGTGTQQLAAFIDSGVKAGVLSGQWHTQPQELPCLAGAALEVESHVAKRAILVGAAGGFVAAFSGEGVYPALRSGALAAEVAAEALEESVVQDELARYRSAWRADLAEYLRLPNADLGLLLPMVFSNPQMSRRVARAVLLGQAF